MRFPIRPDRAYRHRRPERRRRFIASTEPIVGLWSISEEEFREALEESRW